MLLIVLFIVCKVGFKGGLILVGIIMILCVIGLGLVLDLYSILFIKFFNVSEFVIIIVFVFKYLVIYFDIKFFLILYLVGY